MITFLGIMVCLLMVIVVATLTVGVFFSFDAVILDGHFKRKVRRYFGVE